MIELVKRLNWLKGNEPIKDSPHIYIKYLSIVIQIVLYFQILNVSAIVLANLCVAYIMTSQNEEVRC